MKKVSLSLVVALNMLTSLYAENNATASTPEDLGTIEVQDNQKLRRDDREIMRLESSLKVPPGSILRREKRPSLLPW